MQHSRVVMVTRLRKGFSLIEVLMSLVVLVTLSIILINLEARILLNARRFHSKLIRLLPLANSLNSLTLVDDLKKGLEKSEFGPETKILLKAENLEKNDLFYNFDNVQKITAQATWGDFKEELIRWIFIYQKNDKSQKDDSKKDDQDDKKIDQKK